MQMETLYVNDSNQDRLEHLFEIGPYDESDKSKILSDALNALYERLVERQMEEKYGKESTSPPGLVELQFESMEKND